MRLEDSVSEFLYTIFGKGCKNKENVLGARECVGGDDYMSRLNPNSQPTSGYWERGNTVALPILVDMRDLPALQLQISVWE